MDIKETSYDPREMKPMGVPNAIVIGDQLVRIPDEVKEEADKTGQMISDERMQQTINTIVSSENTIRDMVASGASSSEIVEALLGESNQEGIVDIMLDLAKTDNLLNDSKFAELLRTPEIVQQAILTQFPQLSEDKAVLEDIVKIGVDVADQIDLSHTVWVVKQELLDALEDREITVEESASISAKALLSLGSALVGPVMQLAIPVLTDKLTELPAKIYKAVTSQLSAEGIANLIMQYITSDLLKVNGVTMNKSESIIMSVLVRAIPDEIWTNVVAGLAALVPTFNGLLSAGPTLVGGLETLLNLSGYLTSHGAPVELGMVEVNGKPYFSIPIGPLHLYMAPTLKGYSVPLSWALGSNPVRGAGKLLEPLNSITGGISKRIITGIRNGQAKETALQSLIESDDYITKALSRLGLTVESGLVAAIKTFARVQVNHMYNMASSVLVGYVNQLRSGRPTQTVPFPPVEPERPSTPTIELPSVDSEKAPNLINRGLPLAVPSYDSREQNELVASAAAPGSLYHYGEDLSE